MIGNLFWRFRLITEVLIFAKRADVWLDVVNKDDDGRKELEKIPVNPSTKQKREQSGEK